MLQRLPIGIQDFEKLRSNNFLYIDKTEKIFDLLNGAGYYFLSRPRRFGKSLLVSTLKEIFLGKKELFKGLWIEDKIEWKSHSVVHLSFGVGGYKELGLVNYLLKKLGQVAEEHELTIESTTVGFALEELITKIYKKYNKQVVLLIDEYDKPIIDFLGKEEIPIALAHRSIMKEFYSPIKDLGSYLRFFLLTGVSKFSKVTIFSELNNLSDITLDQKYSTLLGYTEAEVLHYFVDYLKQVAIEEDISQQELIEKMRLWYNGYNFRGEEKVYNPFSILNFFDKKQFDNYWFESGTPSFLIKAIEEGNFYEMKDVEVDLLSLGNFELEDIDPVIVLFQAGYLTIKEQKPFNMFRLGYPNLEVANAMNRLLLAQYARKKITQTDNLLSKLASAFNNNDLETVFFYLNALFADIPYQIFETKKESYYHSIIFLTFKLLGYYSDAEVSTAIGRIDVVVKNENTIYVIEFKVNDTAENALQQIKDRKYAEKYTAENKTIVLIGVACNEKTIKEYLVEQL